MTGMHWQWAALVVPIIVFPLILGTGPRAGEFAVSSVGNSVRQGPHQVAKNVRTTQLP